MRSFRIFPVSQYLKEFDKRISDLETEFKSLDAAVSVRYGRPLKWLCDCNGDVESGFVNEHFWGLEQCECCSVMRPRGFVEKELVRERGHDTLVERQRKVRP